MCEILNIVPQPNNKIKKSLDHFNIEAMTLSIASKNRLGQMVSNLKHTEKDIQEHFYILSDMLRKATDRKEAIRINHFFKKHAKLKAILEDLLLRLKNIVELSRNGKTEKITTELDHIQIEVVLFSEMHFRVKKSYFKKINQYMINNQKSLYVLAA